MGSPRCGDEALKESPWLAIDRLDREPFPIVILEGRVFENRTNSELYSRTTWEERGKLQRRCNTI
jgi:hypothetical protein